MTRRVLGVDPGSSATGWALVIAEGNRYRLEHAAVVRPKGGTREARLADLACRLDDLVADLHPDTAAVETPFTGRNPSSALRLAETRGVILSRLGVAGLDVHAYSPAAVKLAVVGHGAAEKSQIVFMVMRLLGLTDRLTLDAADAAAVALTHLHSTRWLDRR